MDPYWDDEYDRLAEEYGIFEPDYDGLDHSSPYLDMDDEFDFFDDVEEFRVNLYDP